MCLTIMLPIFFFYLRLDWVKLVFQVYKKKEKKWEEKNKNKRRQKKERKKKEWKRKDTEKKGREKKIVKIENKKRFTKRL